MTPPPPRVDGRTARSERTRNAIVDAHVRLIQDGDLRPTADRIAKAAGVSLRALWSHFADMEALFAASGERTLRRRDAGYLPVASDLPLDERIEGYCRQRVRMLEQIGPAARAAALKEPFSPTLRRYRRAHVDRVRDELRSLFAAEVAAAGAGGDELVDALTGVSTFPAWSTWRDAMEMDVDAARGALTRAVRALLRP